MKKNQDKLELLGNTETPYFCGSAVFLSLVPLLLSLEKEIQNYKEAYPDLMKINQRLFDEDPVLFDLSKKKETYTKEEWITVLQSLEDYGEEIRQLSSLCSLCQISKREDYVSFLKSDIHFLKGILQDTLAILYEREDKTIEFDRVAHDAFLSMEGEEK